MCLKPLILIIWFGFFLLKSKAELKRGDPNVCRDPISNKSEYTPEELKLKRQNCFQKEVSDDQIRSCIYELTESEFVWKLRCCDGFDETETGCEANCSNCLNERNECIAPNTCECRVGFGYSESSNNCDQECEIGKFGYNCGENCDNILGRSVMRNNQGFAERACLRTKYTYLRKKCKCKKSLCKPGITGENCDQPCDKWKLGGACLTDCSCLRENSSGCDNTNSDCICNDKYYGKRCDKICNGVLHCLNHSKNCVCL